MINLENITKDHCGIYCITNIVNNKKYVGKSVNIKSRTLAHIGCLDVECTNENKHFNNAWKKYGKDCFRIDILELCNYEKLPERELHWMTVLNTTDNKIGYNKRMDSSGGMIPHEDTRKLLSERGIQRYINNPELKEKMGIRSSLFWKNNPDVKAQMAIKVSEKTTKYKVEQYDKEGNLLYVYNGVKDVIDKNPEYYDKHIYNAMSTAKSNRYKHYAYGFKWVKVLHTRM